MSGIATAALKFPVALSSFGIQKLVGALPLGDTETGKAVRASLYKTGESAKQDFASNTALFGAFQFSDKAQSALIDFAADAVTLKAFTPSYMRNMFNGLMQGSSGAIGAVGTAFARNLLREQFGNTFDVISYVNHVDAPSTLTPDGDYPIDEMIAKMYSRGDYPALWLVEGLGERYAHAYLNDGEELYGLLSSGKGLEIPDKTQLMMHAGMGIIFAKHCIAKLTPCSPEGEIGEAIKQFLDMCDANSQERYKGAAVESLGLVTRTWYGQMVQLIYAQLLKIDQAASEYFWRGAGRAMYFAPMYMLPGFSPWQAANTEPPDDTARRNARAGVAWAFTIVNIRQPQIHCNFLRNRNFEIAGNDAFTTGVYSTLLMAGEMVPDHAYVKAFAEFKPDPNDKPAVEAWERFIGTDCEARLAFYRKTLKAANKMGEVFRYHPLPEYIEHLAAGLQS